MRLLLAIGIIAATALDLATYYRLPALGEGELNPIVIALGPLAVVTKLLFGAGIIWAIRHRARFAVPIGAFATAVWGFGAYVNSL